MTPWVVVPLLGPAYVSVVVPSQILLVGAAFTVFPSCLDEYFVNQLHRPDLASILAWISVALGLTLAVIFIPAYAEEGAAGRSFVLSILGSLVYVGLYYS